MDQEKIGKFLSELRKEHGMTQQQLADAIGVSNSSVIVLRIHAYSEWWY